MQFPTQFPFLVIPTGAGPGQQRITINYGQDGKIKVYDSAGHLVDAIGGAEGQFILYDTNGNMVVSLASTAGTDDVTGLPFQAGITVYTATTAINMFGNDLVLTASDGSELVLETGSSASIFFTPSPGSSTYNAGDINTTIGGGNHPGLMISSPSDTVNTASSSIVLEGASASSTSTILLMQATTSNINAICSFGNMVFGSTNITPSAVNTPTNATISYSALKGSSFSGFSTANTSVPQNVSSSIRSITSTGATLTLVRSDSTTTTTVYWQVWGQ